MLTRTRIAFLCLILIGMSVLSAHTTQASPAGQTVPPFPPPLCVVPTGTVGWYEVSADAIGIHTEKLWLELAKGQSIADVAAANGVERQAVIDAIVASESAQLATLVERGCISQAVADQLLAEVPAQAAAFVDKPHGTQVQCHVDILSPNWHVVAADATGLSLRELWSELAHGHTVADVATTNGVDPQAVIDAIVTAESEYVGQLVTLGCITQDEADAMLADLPADAAEFVNREWGARIHCGVRKVMSPNWHVAAADAMGIPVNELWVELASGLSIADVAAANGVERQAVIDAIVQAESEHIARLVDEGCITQDEADAVLIDLPADAAEFVDEAYRPSAHCFPVIDLPFWDREAAGAIGISVVELWSELESGRSIADVASANAPAQPAQEFRMFLSIIRAE